MNTFRRTVAAVSLFAICLLISIGFKVSALGYSGKCGDNLTYSFNNGTLVISGTGPMYESIYPKYSPFDGDSAIKTVIIEEGVTSVCTRAFYNCKNLTEVTLPDTIERIDGQAFDGTALYSNENNWIDGVLYIDNHLISAKKDLEGNYFVREKTISIAYHAFYQCTHLEEIFLPDSLRYICEYAFDGCTSLSYISIGQNISRIDAWAFGYMYNCSNLKTIVLPNSPIDISSTAFNKTGCYTTASNWTESYCNGAFYIGNHLIDYVPTDTMYEIREGTISIARGAFEDCAALSSVYIPDSVELIGNSIFYGCYALKDIFFAGPQEQWDMLVQNNIDEVLNVVNVHIDYKLPHTHTMGEWIILQHPTFSEIGQRKQICSTCSMEKIEFIPRLIGRVASWNITLCDDFEVSFYLKVSKSIESTTKVRLMIGDELLTYNISALEKTEEGCYLLNAEVSAAQMNDYIVVMVMNGADIGSTATYSVRQYCDTILADSSQSEYHALVKEMLNYGAMAQIYFDYDADNLANNGITHVANADVPESTEDMSIGGRINGLNFYGASLVYRDRVAVRYYFAGDVIGCTFSANGYTYTPIAKDAMYYIEIPDILPQNLDQQITLTVTDTEGNTLTVSYGPMNYIVRMNAKGSDDLKNLLKALYNYHLAAKAL